MKLPAEENYDHLKLHSYDLWDLYLHQNQYPYLGRSYAWAKRESAKSLLDMNKEERDELFDIILPTWNKINAALFEHDLSNFAILANTARHLHAHFIPRYYSERQFEGIDFLDPNPNGNYAPYDKKKLPLTIIQKIHSSFQVLL